MKLSPLIWLSLWFGSSLLLLIISGNSTATHVLPRTLGSPTLFHPAGFDAFGRDVLSLTLRASLLSGGFALAISFLSCLLGIILGSVTALASARTRFFFQRTNDLFLAFPSLLLALAWAAARGPGWDTLFVSLGLGILPSFVRLMQARAREIVTQDYVHAARALGCGDLRLIRYHLAPPLISLCAIKLPGLFAQALLAEATLSFLGLGTPIGRETWGTMLAQGKEYLVEAPHIALGSGIPLALTVLSLQLLSETRRPKLY